MAETIAILGLISSIVSLVEIGSRVARRLKEFKEEADELSGTLQSIKVRLPLIIDVVQRIQRQFQDEMVGEGTAQALMPVVEACKKRVAKVEAIIIKVLPAEGASSWERHVIAVMIFSYDKDIEQISTSLEAHVCILTYHQISITSDLSRKSLAFRNLPTLPLEKSDTLGEKPAFMVSFARDDAFVGRETILTHVGQKLRAEPGRAGLTGIGGVG